MIRFEIDNSAGVALLKCVSQRIQQIELEMDRAPSHRLPGLRAEWEGLDDVLASLQEAKRDMMGVD